MSKTRYLPEAREDLTSIWWYVLRESGSIETADRVLDRLDDACQLLGRQPVLGRQPDMGQLRDELAPGIRSFTVGKYAVFYTPVTTGIEIVQIIHGARDIPTAFRRRG